MWGVGMKWDFNYSDHLVSVLEEGLDSLVAVCHSCSKTVGTFTQAEYPKYRLAFHAAEDALREHASRPLDKAPTA
jgi:hypothetical protein